MSDAIERARELICRTYEGAGLSSPSLNATRIAHAALDYIEALEGPLFSDRPEAYDDDLYVDLHAEAKRVFEKAIE